MKGQSVHHIVANNKDEFSVSEKSLYRYVADGLLKARNIDMPRVCRLKPRSSKPLYKDGPIDEQVKKLTKGKGVDKIIIAGGDVDTFNEAVKSVKPGGIISNVNYLGSGDFIKIPREEWIVGMGHIRIVGGLMPAGRMRTERLANLMVTGRLDVSGMLTHKFEGLDSIPEALELMKNKPSELIKPVITISYE